MVPRAWRSMYGRGRFCLFQPRDGTVKRVRIRETGEIQPWEESGNSACRAHRIGVNKTHGSVASVHQWPADPGQSILFAAYEHLRSSSTHPLQTFRLDFGHALNDLDGRLPSRAALAAIPQRLEFVGADGVAVPVVDCDSWGVHFGHALGLAAPKAGGAGRGRKAMRRPPIRLCIRNWFCRLLAFGAGRWLAAEFSASSRSARVLRGSDPDAVRYQSGPASCQPEDGGAERQPLRSVKRTAAPRIGLAAPSCFDAGGG